MKLKTHCKHGHPFNKANTVYWRRGPRANWRQCRECNRLFTFAYYHDKDYYRRVTKPRKEAARASVQS